MKKYIIGMILCSCTALSLPVLANSTANSLGTCMVDSLNGKERKTLAKWIFFAIAAHPEINAYAKISHSDNIKSDETVGKLITRLLTKDCPNELKIANKADSLAIQKAFELVGKVAMQELMTDEKVTTAITSYINYVDQNAINKLLAPK